MEHIGNVDRFGKMRLGDGAVITDAIG